MTNVPAGSTVLSGDLGVNPGSAITGFPPGVVNGATHAGGAVAGQAHSDLTTAYNDAAGRTPAADLGAAVAGATSKTAGVYQANVALLLGGTLTLDGQGNPNAVFIFQVGSMLTVATGTNVIVSNSAHACNVFWQIGTSATLGSGTSFRGTIMALASITVGTSTTVEGRALARNGEVTLENNVFTKPGPPTSGSSGTASATAANTGGGAATGTATATSTGTGAGGGGGGPAGSATARATRPAASNTTTTGAGVVATTSRRADHAGHQSHKSGRTHLAAHSASHYRRAGDSDAAAGPGSAAGHRRLGSRPGRRQGQGEVFGATLTSCVGGPFLPGDWVARLRPRTHKAISRG